MLIQNSDSNLNKYLLPTQSIDSDNPDIIAYAEEKTYGINEDLTEKAVRLFYAVRDGIRYDPYYPFYLPEHYKAGNILKSRRGFCISKASLLCALGRSCGIPSRVGFATVKNHLATKQLLEFLGSDLFVYHGYVEFYLNGKWIKATPTFNVELCRRHRVNPLEFNGFEDAIFHPYNNEQKKFMEYLEYHGEYSDIPVNDILRSWEKAYGKDRVKKWIENFEQSGGKSIRSFDKEDVI